MEDKLAPDKLFLDYLISNQIEADIFYITFVQFGELNGKVVFRHKLTGICYKGKFVICREKYSNGAVITILLSGSSFIFAKKPRIVPPAMVIATTEDFLDKMNTIYNIIDR
jgi:hypothetical protein